MAKISYRWQPAKTISVFFEGDTGANTGGMGAYSPAPVVTQMVHDKVIERVIRPVVEVMKANGTPYTGFFCMQG